MGRLCLGLGCLVWLAAGPAEAAVRRLAVVVGSNDGGPHRPALRYAESDADKLSRVLVELAGVSAADVRLLKGAAPEEVRGALEWAARAAAEARRDPATRVVLWFHYSGHSDGEALELSGQRVPYSQLKEWLARTEADVRLVVLDACHSGAAVGVRGLTAVSPADVTLEDALDVRGEAWLVSSAAHEAALESKEIEGGFFTHAWASGLRGAADASRDGAVTLAEAYAYAARTTLARSLGTRHGAQHPGFEYRLSGARELVLTWVAQADAQLILPRGYDRIFVSDATRDALVAELQGREGPPPLALRQGRYVVSALRDTRLHRTVLQLQPGERRAVQLEEWRTREADPRGVAWRESPSLRVGLWVGAGAAVAQPTSVRTELSVSGASGGGPFVALSFGVSPMRADLRQRAESSSGVQVGYLWEWARGPLRLLGGASVGAGAVWQGDGGGVSGWTASLSAGPVARLGWVPHPTWELFAQAGVPVTALRVDGETRAQGLPHGGVGGAWRW